MELIHPNPQETRFSNKFFANFRHGSDEPKEPRTSQSSTPETPPHRMIYNRTGNLATITQLNREVADGFMRRADMRKDLVVVDSDQRPEEDAVAVSQDTLAMRVKLPIERLTEVRFRPKPLFAVTRQDGRWQIKVFERVIDDRVRKSSPVDTDDYKRKFLELLNKSIKGGAAESLFHEKFDSKEQRASYKMYLGWLLGFTFSSQALAKDVNILRELALIFLTFHPMGNFLKSAFCDPYSRPWQEGLLPLVPVDKWALGAIYLARHGNQLIVFRENNKPKEQK